MAQLVLDLRQTQQRATSGCGVRQCGQRQHDRLLLRHNNDRVIGVAVDLADLLDQEGLAQRGEPVELGSFATQDYGQNLFLLRGSQTAATVDNLRKLVEQQQQ